MKKPELGFMAQLKTKNILDDLDFAVKNNFDWFSIDLDWPQNYDLSERTIKKIIKISGKNKIKLDIHTPYYLPTGALIPEVNKAVIQYLKKSVIFTHKVGADRLTIHPGYKEIPALVYDSLIKNLRTIVNFAKPYQVTICLENFNAYPNLACVELEDFLNVLKKIKGLKATLDVGHSNTTKIKPVEYFKKVKGYVANIHIHDNNGTQDNHINIGEGNIDFKKLFLEFRKAKYFGPFILELFPLENVLRGKKLFLKTWDKI